MSKKKSELKVSINCQKCKTGVLKAVAKLSGVDEVKLDAEKGVLTVVGSNDPVCVATTLRKAGYYAEITTVGPPKKPDDKPKSPSKQNAKVLCDQFLQCYCKQCQLVGVTYDTYNDRVCSIL